VVRREVGGDAIPRLAKVAGPEEELRADVDGALLLLAHMDRRVPVEAELAFLVVREGLEGTSLVRLAVHASDLAALRLRVDESRIGRVGEHPEAVAAEHVLPLVVGDAAGIVRLANPRAV